MSDIITVRKSTPTQSDVHVSRPLTNISIAYMQDPEGFVADKVFPNVPVEKQADKYWQYPAGAFNRISMQKRAPGTESAAADYDVDASESYFCDEWSLHHDIPDSRRRNEDSPLNSDRDATEFLSQQALLRREKQFATKFFTTGIWTTNIVGVAAAPGAGQVLQWNDANSDPLADVAASFSTMLVLASRKPNKMIVGYQVWEKLKNHPDILDRFKATGTMKEPARVQKQILAELFEVEEFLVMEAIENTAAQGATASNAFIGGKSALLVHAAKNPGLYVPSAGYTFSWKGETGLNGPGGQRIKKIRMEHLNSDRAEISMEFDMKKVGADLGYFFSTIVA